MNNARTRVCFTLHVRPEILEEYRRRHRDVSPEVLEALAYSGWHNYSLFLDDNGLLVGYLETDDFAAAQSAMAQTEVSARWQAEMAPFFVELHGRPDESMRTLSLVFQLETQLGALTDTYDRNTTSGLPVLSRSPRTLSVKPSSYPAGPSATPALASGCSARQAPRATPSRRLRMRHRCMRTRDSPRRWPCISPATRSTTTRPGGPMPRSTAWRSARSTRTPSKTRSTSSAR